MRTSLLVTFLLFAGLAVHAAPSFDQAKITFIQHDVSVADLKVLEADESGQIRRRDASLNETVSKDNAVITGQKSRAELEFNDGTLTRLGQLTSFTFVQGTRELQIKQGTALFVVPKGLGGTTIQAGPVTAAITGTTLMVQVVGGRAIIYVYEGSVVVAGHTLTAGQVISIDGSDVVVKKFDTSKGVATAALFTKFIQSPSAKLVEKELANILSTAGSKVGGRNDLNDNAVLNPKLEHGHHEYPYGDFYPEDQFQEP